MTDKLIRELLIDVKQRGGSKAAKQIRDVEAALDRATQSSEGLNKSLGKLPATFTTLERSVSRTQKSLEKLASTTSITTLAASIGMLSTKFTEFEVGLAKSVLRITSQLNNISTSANKMGVDITAAMTSSSPHLDKVNKILAELSANANQAASALSKIKAGTNLANTSTSVNKLGASMTKLKADLEASVSGIEANLGQLSRAFASMSSVGGLNPLGNSIKGMIPQLNQLAKAAKQVNSALAKIQAGRGVLQLPNQFKAITQSLNALETKLASTSQILESGFSKGFQDMATKSTSSSTRMINNFQKVVPELNAIEAAAIRSAAAIDKLIAKRIRLGQTGGGGKPAAGFNMGTIVAEMNRIVTAIEAMGNKMNTTMADMARSTDKVSDKLTDLNAGVRDVNTGLGGLNSTLTGTAGAAGRASRAIGNTSGSARGATRDFAAMAKVGGSLPLMYAAIASNVFVLQSAFEQLKIGDQLNRLEKFGTIVGTQTGTPVQTLARSLQEAAGYAISFEEAMRQASSASAYGFDAEQLNKFGLVARRAAAVLGVDMTDALNRVIKGVSKQEIELLDELGVTIRLNDAYADYVKQLNAANTGITYNVNSLTTFQKQQAYANAVIAESTKRFGYLDEVLRATPWEQFAANADAALRKIQQAAAKYLGPVIDSINAVFYTSQASISAEAARAQKKPIKQMDGKDSNAVVMNLEASQKGLDDAVKAKEEVKNKLAALNKEIMDREAKMDMSTTLATAANYSGFGNPLYPRSL
ncbi:pore-forming tail tip protein [Klebsiella phage vB_Kpn_3]|nr:pore-forming tail tip protein [Klebsiella phage vB_Kpn_3]